LTASAGTWTDSPTSYTYQWQLCDGDGNNCASIGSPVNTSATSVTRKLSAATVAYTVRVVVFASNSRGDGSPVASDATDVVDSGLPSNTAVPTISGNAVLGQILTASAGTWTDSPTSYSYQWLRCDTDGNNCVGIGSVINTSATSITRKLNSGDVGNTMKVVVFASNSRGDSILVLSDATDVVDSGLPSNTAAASITGLPIVGQILTVDAGTWTDSPTSYSYQWQRCDTDGNNCVSVGSVITTSATSITRTLTNGDAGHTMRVVIIASNSRGDGTTAVTDLDVVVS
jgi:hypothetical protein